MDEPQTKSPPFATNVPLHRIPPLAPSQELAYRRKCIQLKRRLAEIEANNDATRRRIEQEKNFQSKLRLNRAILLNHLKDVMETPHQKVTHADPHTNRRGNGSFALNIGSGKKRPIGEYLLDDSSDETEDDEIREPQERPTRFKRSNHTTMRDAVMNNGAPASTSINNLYPQNTFPSLAPAGSYSPDLPREPAVLTSSFRVPSSTPAAAQVPQLQQPAYVVPQHQQQAHLSSPYQPQIHQQTHLPTPILSHGYPPGPQDSNPTPALPGGPVHHQQQQSQPPPPPPPPIYQIAPTLAPRPNRPSVPYEQFTEHMTPQLEADNYPPEQINARISDEWANLSQENRALWDQRYQDQMVDYEQLVDQWKREQRRLGSTQGQIQGQINGVGGGGGGGAGGNFAAVNR